MAQPSVIIPQKQRHLAETDEPAESILGQKPTEVIVPEPFFRYLVDESGLMAINSGFFEIDERLMKLIGATEKERERLDEILSDELRALKEAEAAVLELQQDSDGNSYYVIPAIPDAANRFISDFEKRSTGVLGSKRGAIMSKVLDFTLNLLDCGQAPRRLAILTTDGPGGVPRHYFELIRGESTSQTSFNSMDDLQRFATRYGHVFDLDP